MIDKEPLNTFNNDPIIENLKKEFESNEIKFLNDYQKIEILELIDKGIYGSIHECIAQGLILYVRISKIADLNQYKKDLFEFNKQPTILLVPYVYLRQYEQDIIGYTMFRLNILNLELFFRFKYHEEYTKQNKIQSCIYFSLFFQYYHFHNLYHLHVCPCFVTMKQDENNHYSHQIVNIDKLKSNQREWCLQLSQYKKYQSPELLINQQFLIKSKSDIWSLGLLYYYILTGSKPWKNLSDSQILEFMSQKNVELMFEENWKRDMKDNYGNEIGEILINIIEKMTHLDQEQRELASFKDFFQMKIFDQDPVQITFQLIKIEQRSREVDKNTRFKYLLYPINPYFNILCKQISLNKPYYIISLKDYKIQYKEPFYIAEAIQMSIYSILISLELINNQITDVELQIICKGLVKRNTNNIKQISISNNNITEKGAQCLSNSIIQINLNSLQYLDLSINQIKNEGAFAIIKAIIQVNCKLLKLNLSYNQINDDDPSYLNQCILFCNDLIVLNLNGNQIGQKSIEQAIQSLAQKKEKLLQQIDLNDNLLSDAETIQIMQYIEQQNWNSEYKISSQKIFEEKQ